MKKNLSFLVFGAMVLGTFLLSCQKENKATVKYESQNLQLPAQTPDYNISVPNNGTGGLFPGIPTQPLLIPKINNEQAQLGRVLFYDKKLSLNNTVACASCHKQNLAFSDDVAFSRGFNEQVTTRNSMAISNCAFTTDFFWDGRAKNLAELVLQPARNHIEMGMETTADIIAKLEKTDYYAPLFEKGFGSREINKERIIEAMSQFLNSMVSSNSKFDEGKINNFANFSAQEKQGQAIFQQNCSGCHAGFNLNSNEWDSRTERANIGLDMHYADQGMGNLDNKANGVFKVPSLRNIALTGPYMHDGRFATLADVVNHYNENIQANENLDWRLQGFSQGGGIFFPNNPNGTAPEPKRMNMSEVDKQNLIAFLNTFTDQKFISDKKFSNPFQ